MTTKRREFIKAIGLSSGALFIDPNDVFGREIQHNGDLKADHEVFEERIYDTDLLVIGGGMAGVCAAISAARNGLKVVIIQNRSRLGGNASSEIRMHISGATALKKVWRETGILEELMLTDAVENPQRSYEIWDYILYDKVISEKNITLLLDTTLLKTETVKGKITRVTALCSPTEELYKISAKFFADCTGDGTLAAQAGAECLRGREGKDKWGESLAADQEDKNSMGNSILFTSEKHDAKMPYAPPSWAKKYTNKDFVHRKISQWEYGYWWLELGGLEDTITDGQKNRHDLLSVLFGVWDFIKNSGNYPEADNWALSWVGMIPGKRESRRIVGDYILKQDDIQNPKMFADRVAYGGWPLDDHPPGGMNTTGIVPYISIPLKAPYSIPLRSLYSKNISNLFMAGRNISASHVALSSTRVMATCAAMGQAIGSAAAYCSYNTLLPKALAGHEKHFFNYQQLMLRQDQPMLDVENADDSDIAKKATITASSYVENYKPEKITDGYNREVGDGKVHQWRANLDDGKAQWIELKWPEPIKLSEIQLIFDTGLNRFLRISSQDSVYKNQIRGAQPETVADYSIEVNKDGNLVPLVRKSNNYLRRSVHNFESVETDRIRIYVERTSGDKFARIFEVRCYGG